MDEGLVYVLYDKKEGKYYVGQTTQDLATRIQQHVYQAWAGSRIPLSRAIRKAGADGIYVVRVEYLSREALSKREADLMTEFRSHYPEGYNVMRSGHVAQPSWWRPRKLRRYEQLVLEAYEKGKTYDEIATFYGVSVGTVRNVLLRHNVKPRRVGRRKATDVRGLDPCPELESSER
jgi:hypothetical protein